MNHGLDQFLVGMLLALSAGYAFLSLGPRALRMRILGVLSDIVGRLPPQFGLSRWTQKLQAAATAKPKGACGGCEDCGTGVPSNARTTPTEIKIPVGKIGRRS